LLSMEGETTLATQLIMYVILFALQVTLTWLFLHLTIYAHAIKFIKYEIFKNIILNVSYWVTNMYLPMRHLSYPQRVFLPTAGGATAKKKRIWKVA
jgi:hypothetical protein